MEGSGNSDVFHDQGSDLVTPYFTPYQKQTSRTSGLEPVVMDLSLSSGGDSSVASVKEDSGSPYSSSSDSESDYDGSLEGIKLKEQFHDLEEQYQLVGEEKTDSEIWDGENKNYEELLKKFIQNEEELMISNSKLQRSEEEIVKLKSQLENSEVQLDNVQNELKVKEADLACEKGQVLELKKQTAELETHVPDCCYKIAKLAEQLEVAQEQIKESNDEIARLKEELRSKSSGTHQLQGQLEAAQEFVSILECQLDSERNHIRELEDRISLYKANEIVHELEVQKLKAEIVDSQAKLSLEKDQFLSNIISLTEEKMELSSRLKESETKINAFENNLDLYKMEQEKLHATQQSVLQVEISGLKEKLSLKTCEVNALNKEFDSHKQKYDMLMTERDGASANIDNLTAKLSLQEDIIANVDRELLQVRAQREELISQSETKLNLVNELKLKVEELEKEVAKQNAVISGRDEEKREAIRQLCFALEHYRSGYQEILRAFTGHRRHAVIAS